jgi:tRNA nucleotidyltransferase (CCA-adding enzyme)
VPRRRTLPVILTHENADFDAIASLLAAWKLYPDATPVLPRRVNRNGRAFLALYGGELPMMRVEDLPRASVERAILVDTQSLTTVKGMQPNLSVLIIDHHPLSRELPEGWTYRGEPTGATTTLLVEQIAAAGLAVSPVETTLMLLGIYEDTGSLSYLTTTARDAHAAGWLLERGANLAVANEYLHHPLGPEQQRLYRRLRDAVETHTIHGHALVIATATADSFDEELSTLAHKLRDLLEPSALLVLVALDGYVQLVARSATDDIDVAVIAGHFGGGGHTRAAAALIRDRRLDSVREELLALLPDVVQPAVRVEQLMSRGVQTVQADMTVAEAAARMERTGHEGYPVVRDGQVVGLLTRQAVDRAQRHHLDRKAVADVMDAGAAWVTPDDPMEKLQALMAEYGWGQMPVVEHGQVTGIVTRTDLVKLWSRPARGPSVEEEINSRLSQALSPATLALVHRVSQAAAKMGYSIYFVGGLVRDLLLDIPIVDIDIVVEGDAIALARRLRRQLGGRVRSHSRFGTAKWLIDVREPPLALPATLALPPGPAGPRQGGHGRGARESNDDESAPGLLAKLSQRLTPGETGGAEEGGLPSAIDFVTARTEFYTHPTALPEVERSSIKQDLHRRDFTINTLAIRLDPDHFGKLLDFYGGAADLRQGVIRVLHSLSFIEDPTRILRAARLEARLGFHIEPRTEQLIADALPLLDRVSGDRIRHELVLIFHEAEPERALCRLQELGVLEAFCRGLRCDRWLQARFERLRQAIADPAWALDQEGLVFVYLALLLYRLPPEKVKTCQKRLKLARDDVKRLGEVEHIKAHVPGLEQAQPASTLFRWLSPYSTEALLAAWAAEKEPARRQIQRFQSELREVRTLLDGRYLIECYGLKPGPIFGRLLNQLRDARLDGQVETREDEEALVERLLGEMNGTGGDKT